MTFDEALEKCRREAQSAHEKGARFEQLMKKFLQTNPQYREKFSAVWLWKEFPWREEFDGKDVGIDIVAQTTDGEYWAVPYTSLKIAEKILPLRISDLYGSARRRKFSMA